MTLTVLLLLLKSIADVLFMVIQLIMLMKMMVVVVSRLVVVVMISSVLAVANIAILEEVVASQLQWWRLHHQPIRRHPNAISTTTSTIVQTLKLSVEKARKTIEMKNLCNHADKEKNVFSCETLPFCPHISYIKIIPPIEKKSK